MRTHSRMDLILRRRKLGRTSAREIIRYANDPDFKCLRNDKALPPKVGVLFRWGCTSQQDADLTVNTAKAIGLTADKYRSRLAMQEAGVSIPKTWEEIPKKLPKEGVILRNHFHHQGRHLVYAKTQQELEDGYYQLRERGAVYVSEFIPKVKEYRVYVVQGRVAMVAEKTPSDPDAIAWNHHLGGSFENVRWKEWPRKACLEGIKAAVSLGLDFSGSDVIVDVKGTPYVLEGNSAPSMTSEYRQRCFAKCFNWIRERGKERIHITKPPKNKKNIYPYIIHPAVAEEARLQDV